MVCKIHLCSGYGGLDILFGVSRGNETGFKSGRCKVMARSQHEVEKMFEALDITGKDFLISAGAVAGKI